MKKCTRIAETHQNHGRKNEIENETIFEWMQTFKCSFFFCYFSFMFYVSREWNNNSSKRNFLLNFFFAQTINTQFLFTLSRFPTIFFEFFFPQVGVCCAVGVGQSEFSSSEWWQILCICFTLINKKRKPKEEETNKPTNEVTSKTLKRVPVAERAHHILYFFALLFPWNNFYEWILCSRISEPTNILSEQKIKSKNGFRFTLDFDCVREQSGIERELTDTE